MAALIPDYEYDIFISYRQNDNKYDGWVTKFVENLQKELEATIKADISVYFDENPHDGLLDTHQVDESLATKLKCLIFIPVISQTYCDTNSFAWQHEFIVFKKMASEDSLGMFVKLPNGNVCSRVLPVKIHSIDQTDQTLLENELGGALRSIDFIHQAPGINRPLDSKRDDQYREDTKIIYRDQINKVANSIKEILIGIKSSQDTEAKVDNVATKENSEVVKEEKFSFKLFGKSLLRRNIPQVALVYTAFSVIIQRILASLIIYNILPVWVMSIAIGTLIFGGFIAIGFAWAFEFGPEGLMRTSSWESRLNPYPGYKRKPFTGIATISALALVLLFQALYFNYFPSWFAPKLYYLESKAIAVLPFEDQTENIDKNDYFSKDLTDNITVQLSKIQALRVIGFNSTKQYKDNPINYQQIGEDLNVSVVLTGSVRRFGEQLRIICQLIEVQTHLVIWSDIYPREMKDVFDIQSEIALLIAQVMEIELTNTEIIGIEKKPTNNITAYDHYLKGRKFYYQYQKEANDLAILEFKAAIALDSTYALAWSGLGDAYSQMNAIFGMDKAWNDTSIIAATRAIILDPTSEEAYKALGNAYNSTSQYEKALEYFLKATDINPNYAPAIGNIGSTYHSLGKLEQSIEWQLRGADLSPNSFIPPVMLGWTYRLLSDYDRAESWLSRSIRLQPYADTYRELGYTYVLQGKKDLAMRLITKVLDLGRHSARNYEQAGLIALFANELDSAYSYFQTAVEINEELVNDPNSIAPLALAYFKLNSNEQDAAIEELDRLEGIYLDLISEGSQDDDHRINLAAIKSMQGNPEASVKWLERALNYGWNDIAIINNIPWFEPIHLDPEYEQIIRELEISLREMRQQADAFQ